MKSSCIQHPPNEPLIIIRQWQLEACEGNACAAALLSFFEYWHNIKIEQSRKAGQQNAVAEQHGDEGTQDTSLLQFHNEDELEAGVLIYKRDTIRAALKLLEALKFITVQPNPNPKYAFDKTRYFGFQDGVVARWLKNRLSSPKSRSRSRKNQARSQINPSPITETSSETTNENKETVTAQPTASQNGNKKGKTNLALKELSSKDRNILEVWFFVTDGYYPPKRTWEYILERLRDEFDPARLKRCGAAYLANYSMGPQYVAGMCDWYLHNQIEKGNGNGTHQQQPGPAKSNYGRPEITRDYSKFPDAPGQTDGGTFGQHH